MGQASTCTVRTRVWRNGTLEAENFPIEQLSDYLAEEDCLVWADILEPDSPILATLAEELELDQHAVEDAVAPHERPKAMRYSTHTFLTTYALRLVGDDELQTSRLSAFVLKHGVVTVRLDDHFTMEEVVRRWDDNADLLKYGPKALVHGLLDTVVDGYFETIGALDDAIEAIEDELFKESASAARGVQRTTFQLRKALVVARRAVLPMREVVNTVTRSVTDGGLNTDLAPYYADLYDHVIRAAEWTESLRDMVTSVFETTLSLSDVRMNMIMKKLTGWAAIIAVPTAVTGYFGQNVPYPGFGQHWGFWFSIGAIVLIAIALYVTFRRKDWL
jgi:magnesium transporter